MRNYIAILLLAGAVFFAAVAPCTAQSTDPLSVLNSGASVPEKMEACRALSVNGTKEAIPVLAPLLLDEKLAHMARYVLEPMPYPEAGEVLRDALGKTSGLLKVGVISSLAARKDEQAVPEIAKLLPDADAQVAQAAAKALGDIATPDAASALDGALGQAGMPEVTRLVVCDALLGCAKTFAADKQSAQALAIYDRLLQLPNPAHQVRAAALRGAVLQRSVGDALPLLLDAVRGEDRHQFEAALRIARELDGKKMTGALAGELPSLPDDRKVRLLSVFGQGDDAAGSAALALAQTGAGEVRVAALSAVTRIGYEPALDLIGQLALSEDTDLAKVARDSLSYFPGKKGDAALKKMLGSDNAKARLVAVELIGQGGLDEPVGLLMDSALKDSDESVHVAALTALQGCATTDEMPALVESFLGAASPEQSQATEAVLAAISERQKKAPGSIIIEKAVYGDLPDGPSADVIEKVKSIVDSGALSVEATNANFGDPAPGAVKRLRIDYSENGAPASKTVQENETLKLAVVSAPAQIVDAFCAAFDKAQGDAKLGMIRLLGTTGSPKAFEAVNASVASSDPNVKDQALRTLCEWPTPVALPALSEMAKTSTEPGLKLAALRGTVRLMAQSGASPAELVAGYGQLLGQASSADEKKAVLGGLAQVPDTQALDLVFAQFADEAVKGEAVQAAIGIARSLGNGAAEDASIFNGTDLAGWQGNAPYWRVEEGAIVGGSDADIPKNEFIWSGIEVRDFYLVLDVQMVPNTANAGIQFRSKKVDESGQASGYQADMGQGYWGRLYHEHGRGMLDSTDTAEAAVKPGEWNRYEILAVGPAIWISINGAPGTACLDLNPAAERSGNLALQIHSGAPQTVRYRILKLVHNPKVEMEGLKADDLIIKLKPAEK
ncbi:MAG: DUF1080 domain-containing protein [Candidatus Hydrogenedentes bacterium]|nr:DUF1080 domain-containing protein [Candidatus Hydrogenedentota bacterium]